MQREIDEHNLSQAAAQPEQPQQPEQPDNNDQSKQAKPSKRPKKPVRKRDWRKKQMLDNPNDPPKIRNLVVIPICTYERTHFPIDNDALFCLLREHRLLPQKGPRGGMIDFKEDFMPWKDHYWNQFFYMRKIRWFVRRKKDFSYRILSDGIAVSLQYTSPESEANPIDLDKVRADVEKSTPFFKKAVSIDPGYNKWIAAVQRDIVTEKEVRFCFLTVELQCCKLNEIM